MAIKGERFGEWQLDRKIGNGLSGETWKARRQDQVGSLKIVYEAHVSRLIQEHGLPPEIEGPHWLKRLDVVTDTHLPTIAHEFVEGHSLRALLTTRGYLPVGSALSIILQVMLGISRAHEADVPHWNLRPENVIIGSDGRAMLMDAQTAAVRQGILDWIQSGASHAEEVAPIANLLSYVPPEQRKGTWHGQSADMFAIGVMLYEMTTGVLPAESEIDLRNPSAVDHRIPRIIDDLCFQCLAHSPRERAKRSGDLIPALLDGLERAGFSVDMSGPPAGWIKRSAEEEEAPPAVGEETGRFRAFLKRLRKR